MRAKSREASLEVAGSSLRGEFIEGHVEMVELELSN